MVDNRESALYFDGDADYITIRHDEALRVNHYTVEVWIKPDALGSFKGIVGESEGLYNIGISQTGEVYHNFIKDKKSRFRQHTENNSIHVGKWQHIAITNDGATAKIYINGKLSNSKSATGSPVRSDNIDLRIGTYIHNKSEQGYYKGSMAELRLWNKARSQAEIKQSMFTHAKEGEDGLVGYWPLNDATSNYASDESGNRNHGKISGAMLEEQFPLPSKQGSSKDGGEYVLLCNSPSDNVTVENFTHSTSAVTLSCWARSHLKYWGGINELINHYNVFNLHFSNYDFRFTVYYESNGQMRPDHVSCDLREVMPNLDASKWHNYAATYDGTTAHWYVDGVQIYTRKIGFKIPGGAHTKVTIGKSSLDAKHNYRHKFAEASIWGKVLTASEIKGHLSQRLTGKEDGLLAYWPLNEGHGDITDDNTTNIHASHGILNGAKWDEQLPMGVLSAGVSSVMGANTSAGSQSQQGGPGIGGSTESGKLYQIKNPSGMVLSVQDKTPPDGADVRCDTNSGEEKQKWMITKDGIIQSHLGDFALDMVVDKSDPDKGSVQIQPIDSSSPTQKWILTYDGRLINKSNCFVLVVREYNGYAGNYFVDAVSDSTLRNLAVWGLKSYEYKWEFEEV